MMDTISRQDALAAIATIVARINAINSNAGSVARDALAAINALPAVECKQCSELVHEINGYKDVLAQAEGMIADLRARDGGPRTRWG